ncbi:DEAD/DEAH box helicase family protein [Terribacillus saccharophilus]|uniref:DEAD/DEAH box helicase family protein n=1 Tax=Terribacillus saccharophilus TaxID=361277 RepID=UPI000C9CB1C1|nr:DEAD/DEAH box helicase family protein [Terribacillus goriensis]
MKFLSPSYLQLRDYQEKAISNWFQNNKWGLLEMATGTGKTLTALALAEKLYGSVDKLAIIIVTPFGQLSTQWMDECRQFGLKPVRAYENKNKWIPHFDQNKRAFHKNLTNLFVAVTTNATFVTKDFQDRLSTFGKNTLLIIDEAHYFGAKALNRSLPENMEYRLALTATPTRWMDDDGTDKLLNYFGGEPVFSFTLGEAIQRGFLTKYYYYPKLVHLNEEETEEYIDLSNKIRKLFHQAKENPEIKERMNSLSIKRARIIYSAENKMNVLKETLNKEGHHGHSLFYCGDGKNQGERQVDAVTNMLVEQYNIAAERFTSSESNQERDELLKTFESGETEALVAIKCLDEGIDVPATQYAYLISSSSNPKEFIQRRGRVLRKHAEKNYAILYDFIVVPPYLSAQESDDDYYNMMRNQISKEFMRFKEFSTLAVNGPEAEKVIWELKKEYSLLDI